MSVALKDALFQGFMAVFFYLYHSRHHCSHFQDQEEMERCIPQRDGKNKQKGGH